MRVITLLILFVFLFPLHASCKVRIWNNDTVLAGQVYCAGHFMLDSFAESVANLEMTIEVLDGSASVAESFDVKVDNFGGNSATRYSTFFIESQKVCLDGATILIRHAKAQMEGKSLDLLEQGLLEVYDFKPLKIELGN